jgi:hypothetical protein
MVGLSAAPGPLAHRNSIKAFPYKGYFGHHAECGLDVFAYDKNYVFIVTELPENPGTSVTNRAEMVAETLEAKFGILGHPFYEGNYKSGEVRYTYIEHYPRSKYRGDWDENFSIVTFKRDTRQSTVHGSNPQYYAEPNWTPVEREQVERLIGQPFAPERDYDVKR